MNVPRVVNTEGPINDLFYAINHYISTGDHLGAGTALETEDGGLLVVIPVNKANPDDLADADKFEQKIAELHNALSPEKKAVSNGVDLFPGVELSSGLELSRHTGNGAFDYLLLKLALRDARPLACALVRFPAAPGWGTCKVDLDRGLPGLRQKILSGEGV